MALITGLKDIKPYVIPKIKQRRFRKKTKDVVKEHLNDYFVNTTLHGLKYVGLTNLNIIER